jgi:predicted SnoaL-like aldol condensation-catalyzing enzyme
MSGQKEVLREIARVINSNGTYRITEWFAENFRLIEPTKPNWPEGHVGAERLLETFRTLVPPVKFAILDMIEEGDRVAVRWQLSATHNGEPLHLAMMAIYRFEEGRIAEDWGIPIRGGMGGLDQPGLVTSRRTGVHVGA